MTTGRPATPGRVRHACAGTGGARHAWHGPAGPHGRPGRADGCRYGWQFGSTVRVIAALVAEALPELSTARTATL